MNSTLKRQFNKSGNWF